MAKFTVAVTDYTFPNIDQEKEILEAVGCEIVVGQCKTAKEVIDLCENADAILNQWAPITAEVINSLKRCRIIVRYGIGVDSVDLEAAKARNIAVVNVPDYAIDEVADHAFSLLLASVRKIPQITNNVRGGAWVNAPLRPIVGLQGKTLGLAGFGNIARAVAQRAKGFGINVMAYDPYVSETMFQSHQVEQVEWLGLLERSDFMSVHLPLVDSTRHLLNKEAFARMKCSAFLVNTSRGAVIHTGDLTDALEKGEIAGAALDVLEHEPIDSGNRLLKMDCCLITSHCAWYSEESLVRLQQYAALEIKRLFTGGIPKHIVNNVVNIRG